MRANKKDMVGLVHQVLRHNAGDSMVADRATLSEA
jgi:hypothetical protein